MLDKFDSRDVYGAPLMVLVIATLIFVGVVFTSTVAWPYWEKTIVVLAFCGSVSTYMTWAILVPSFCRVITEKHQEACGVILKQREIIKSSFLTQKIVDGELWKLAMVCEELFFVQVQLREGEDEAQLEEVTEKVARAKEEFWRTHKLAKELGFTVKPKIKNYITNW